MDWKKIKEWDFNDFQSWLSNPDTEEGWHHDLKEIVCLESQKIRNTFCAFANTNGGMIIFGIDNDKNIIGVGKYNGELKTDIDRIVNANILPAIPTNGWDTKEFKIPGKRMKFIYVIYVYPSPYFLKPHVIDNKVYKRNNGENIPINDGSEIRERFLINKFDPRNIDDLERDLNKLKDARFNPDHIDVLYLKSLKGYLDDRSAGRNSGFTELSCRVTEIANLYENIKKKQAIGIATGDSIGVLDSSSILEDCISLSEKINDFLSNYKRAHQI